MENYREVYGQLEHPSTLGDYPIHQDERGIHKCSTGMYPCDQFLFIFI